MCVHILKSSALFGCKNEVIEKCYAVRFRPYANGARILEGVILDLEEFLSIEGNGEDFADELDAKRAPFARGYFRVSAWGPRLIQAGILAEARLVFEDQDRALGAVFLRRG